MCLDNKGCHRLKGQIRWATLRVLRASPAGNSGDILTCQSSLGPMPATRYSNSESAAL